MGSYQWYLTEARRQLLEAAQEIAHRERKDVSAILEELLRKWVEKSQKTHNPQTDLADFEDPTYRALPNLWRVDDLIDLDKVNTEDLREIFDKATQLEYLARKRLKMRGEL
jgi:TRAP-type C4-dicarboxylate transport system substrate-binding protein